MSWLQGNAVVQKTFLALSVSIGSLILGYLFPKSEGSLNETTSTVLLIMFFALLELSNRVNGTALFIILILGGILFYILRKERYERI
ncbi:hypothetical protein [Lactococcus hircilactis]|uniref:hypothetical protein n=1 Tax=Lactococcus hircilactis TaxID=1494462 RepID=UPI001297187B